MFTFPTKTKSEPTKIDDAISAHVSELMGHEIYTDEYTKGVANLRVLMEAKALEPKPDKISNETLALIAGNLVGIAMIISFEKANVLTSKALGFVLRTRV